MTHDPTTDPSTASPDWRALYREQVDALDPTTRSALRLRRRTALANAEARSSLTPRWWPAGSVVAAAALALMVWLPTSFAPHPPRGAEVDDAEGFTGTRAPLAMAEASLATLELDNDSDFYFWLAQAPAETDTRSTSNEATL